jgi:hypothetical protein
MNHMTNTLWTTLPTKVQEQMIEEYMQIEDETDIFARQQLSTMDDDTLRDHLRNGIGWEQVDEHDRNVDRPYAEESRILEGEDKLGFMDMAHALSYAMQAMRERIDYLEPYNAIRSDTTSSSHLYVQRLKQSHDRLAELLLQRDEDVWAEDGDGWLTKAIDTWIRG